MPKPFASFARCLIRTYVVLAAALIVVVVATTSLLAFLLYAGTLNETVAAVARRVAQSAESYERANQTLNAYAAAIAATGGTPVDVRVYDEQHRLLARSGDNASPGRFTLATAAVFGLRPSVVAVDGGAIVVAPDLQGFARLLERYLLFVLPIGD